MLAAGAGVLSVGAYAVSRYRGNSKSEDDDSTNDVVVVEKPSTWKDSSGRAQGPDGYVFGDLTRGVCVKIFGKTDDETEAAGDAQHTQVQKLLREAVKVYRARGYSGTINLSHTVAYFNESVSCSVKPLSGDLAPWEVEENADEAQEEGSEKGDGSTDKIAEEGQAGLVFTTLLARLERRAKAWAAFSGVEGLDPNISQSATIGFALPVIKLGWGVSVSLTISCSSLLRWADRAAALEAAEAAEAPAAAALAPAELETATIETEKGEWHGMVVD